MGVPENSRLQIEGSNRGSAAGQNFKYLEPEVLIQHQHQVGFMDLK